MEFEDWFYEEQNFGLRAESFWNDVLDYQGDNTEILLKWLKAAYHAGFDHASLQHLDDGK